MAGRKRLMSWIVIIIVLAAGAGIMLLLSSQKVESDKIEEKVVAREVETYALYAKPEQIWIEANGFLDASRSLTLISGVGGKLSYVNGDLKGGIKVEKDELLFSLDSREAENNFHRARLELLRLSSAFIPLIQEDTEDADTWRNYLNLLADPNVRDIPMPPAGDGREYLLAATRGILTAWYNLDGAEAFLKEHEVRAPFSGTIRGDGHTAGSLVTPGMALAELVDSHNLEVSVTLPQRELSSIISGASVIVSREGERSYNEGVVERIEPVLQAGTATVHISLNTFPDTTSWLPGAFVKLKIKGIELPDAYRVPRRLLIDGKLPVYDAGKLRLHEVTLMGIQEDDVLLEVTLPEGTEVITTTIQTPLEGMLLKKEGDDETSA